MRRVGVALAAFAGVLAAGCPASPRPAAAPPPALPAASAPAPALPPGFVLVRPATFTMGSPRGEPGREDDEAQHPVTITRAFLLQRTEVTHRQWQALLGRHADRYQGCGDCPVEGVSWWEALEYCNRLSAREGLETCYATSGCSGKAGAGLICTGPVRFKGLACRGYRLPTESEWELAARAGTTTASYAGAVTIEGDAPELGPIAWCGKSNRGAHPVAKKRPNALGLHDMLGNVSEWVWDLMGDYAVDGADPEGADQDAYENSRVYRGGSWNSRAGDCRAASRSAENPEMREAGTGLRPARTHGARVPTTRVAKATTLAIEKEVRRIDADLPSASKREIVFPDQNTLGGGLTIFERGGEVRKIVQEDFGETGQVTAAYYYSSRSCVFVLSTKIRYKTPVNDYGNPDAGQPAVTIQRRYYLAGGKLVRLLKDQEEIELPNPRIASDLQKEAAAALQLASRCPPRSPPCTNCTCETKDCRTLSCEAK